ncbi:sarcosine oxidase [Ketogulonicigenium robustum]|uniref:Sarcosine oxidase n=1 Tax=Ketogulonicigenium robustum TaxID=92947 RepID=A0A1W6P276_9RHOB|nr:FAD-dependent oxidoreductase [Ketogulonicigenium robustum]ARO15491.1 sarcosine oxidase [Ketogulonicigenium robustum]
MKVAIVGAGIGGLSVAWALRKRGVDVMIFDQGDIPSLTASSNDEHRITRHTYGGLPGYAALMPHAFATYDRIWQDIGTSHYLPTGIVYAMRGGADEYDEIAADLSPLGIAHSRLSLAELESRVPFLSLDGVTSAYQAGGSGILLAGRIVRDLAHWLRENGAEMYPNSRVTAVDPDAATVTVGQQVYSADVVVVAAGAWVTNLLPKLADRLTPSRQMVMYLQPPAHHAASWAQAPVLIDVGPSYGAYVLPPQGGMRLKIGDHRFTRIGHGDDDRIATDFDIAPVLAAAQTAFRDFDQYTILENKVCYYTVSDDERFVIEPICGAGWVLSACSGHGFKLGALMGEGLARTLTGDTPAGDVTAWAAGKTAGA